MKKVLQTFIIWLLIGLLAVTVTPFVMGQSTSSVSGLGDVAVILDGETLFMLRKPLGGISLENRAKGTSSRLKEFAEDETLSLDDIDIYIGDTEGIGIPVTAVSAGSIPLITITEVDAKAVNKPRSVLVTEYVKIIKDAVTRYREKRSFQNVISGLIFSVVATIILLILLFINQNVFTKIYQKLKFWGTTYIQAVRLGNFELIKANQLDNVIHLIARILQIGIILGLLIIYFPLVLSQFIWTKSLANTFWDYLSITFQSVWQAFTNYLPNLLTIIIVVLIAWFFLRLSQSFFNELRQETFSLPGFYPEWALPTYRLVTSGIFVLAAVIVIPLLPGFNSPAFQGISVFLGLLFSLGSTSVIANVVSGTILIYTRAFRVGDYITIGEISGKVLETTLLVTRLLTATNVVISIPNSEIITTSISNWSFSSKELNLPLIVRTPVYLGYEIPWQQAYHALMKAAVQTDGVSESPTPFVVQESLNEVYVTYQLSVYINWEYFKGKTLKEFEEARSKLHENIRDCCQEAGIRVFAPSYEADPTNYGPAATECD
ncbi:mechanosensitive ion channel domain-containing protein [Crocosphaera sp. UHCC 0190]|uniref:mechanosensitive ion channel family protein n=1 Tax=Crocosphaera sp. UHCC 0190 TaxID=3110246 RepID=UPI002B1F84D7|nr:mechanosensitive ion channel domain-containing protein [Crocosphaera sp. UHCC 0190]MEA5509251.1 mechanosensitive ion channel domain-containing protein [Crocosphaera sp. UHCC 0190]